MCRDFGLISGCVLVLIGLDLVCEPSFGQVTNVLTSPAIAGCPSPIPSSTTGWPGSGCKYIFYPITDAVHAIASNSKTAPVYQHTFGGYNNSTSIQIVVCPIGALLSADGVKCTDSTGKDASALVPVANAHSFTIAPSEMFTGYYIEHSYDDGATWDSIGTLINYPPQSAPHCFRITAQTSAGAAPAVVVCPSGK